MNLFSVAYKGVAELPISQLSIWRLRDRSALGKPDFAAGVIYQHLALSPNQQWLALAS
ncbi:MAG: hypothetical protein U0175_32605 [Caldilineaceae bacterium]